MLPLLPAESPPPAIRRWLLLVELPPRWSSACGTLPLVPRTSTGTELLLRMTGWLTLWGSAAPPAWLKGWGSATPGTLRLCGSGTVGNRMGLPGTCLMGLPGTLPATLPARLPGRLPTLKVVCRLRVVGVPATTSSVRTPLEVTTNWLRTHPGGEEAQARMAWV